MIACVLAANLDTNSSFMVNTGALFTENLYRRYFRPAETERHYLWVGRTAGIGMTLGAIAVSFLLPQVLDGILFAENLAALMGISFIVGVVWRRANRYGTVASFLTGLVVFYGGSYLRCLELKGEFVFRTWVKWHADLSLYSLLAGLGAMIVVSLLTRPEPREKLDAFYARLQDPATDAAPPAAVPAGAAPALAPEVKA
jgi:Na+/proline symporter